MQITVPVVDLEPAAERIQTGLRARIFAPGHGQRVDRLLHRYFRAAEPLQFRIDKAHVESGIVDNQDGIPDKLQEAIHNSGKIRIIGKELGRKAMHLEGALFDLTLRIDIDVIALTGRHMVDQLDGADFDNPVSLFRVDTRGFRIKNQFTHVEFPSGAESSLWPGQWRPGRGPCAGHNQRGGAFRHPASVSSG